MKKLLMILIFCLSILATSKLVEAGVTDRSEIRGLFVHYPTFRSDTDWDLIAQTAQDLKQNALYIEIMGSYSAKYHTSVPGVTSTTKDHLAEAIQSAHPRGIEVHAVMLVIYLWEGFEYDQPVPEDWRVTRCNGNKYNWLDPCHPDARNRIWSNM